MVREVLRKKILLLIQQAGGISRVKIDKHFSSIPEHKITRALNDLIETKEIEKLDNSDCKKFGIPLEDGRTKYYQVSVNSTSKVRILRIIKNLSKLKTQKEILSNPNSIELIDEGQKLILDEINVLIWGVCDITIFTELVVAASHITNRTNLQVILRIINTQAINGFIPEQIQEKRKMLKKLLDKIITKKDNDDIQSITMLIEILSLWEEPLLIKTENSVIKKIIENYPDHIESIFSSGGYTCVYLNYFLSELDELQDELILKNLTKARKIQELKVKVHQNLQNNVIIERIENIHNKLTTLQNSHSELEISLPYTFFEKTRLTI